jgi:hypothetical protein
MNEPISRYVRRRSPNFGETFGMVRGSNRTMRVVMGQTTSDRGTGADPMDDDDCGHLQCPFCHAYQVERLYIGSLHIDSCTCEACGARWDEDIETGRYRGRGSIESVIVPRQH